MKGYTTQTIGQPDLVARKNGSRPAGFRLMHYFTLTSLVAFTAVALALYVLQQMEGTFFEKVQREQSTFFAQVQTEFMRNQKATARDDMLMLHQASHVNLTHVFSNVLWDADFAPFIAKVRQIPIDQRWRSCFVSRSDLCRRGWFLSPKEKSKQSYQHCGELPDTSGEE